MSFAEALPLMHQRYIVRRLSWAKGYGLAYYKNELWYTKDGALYDRCRRIDEESILALDWVAEKKI